MAEANKSKHNKTMEKALNITRGLISTCMRFTIDTVNRANNRTIARSANVQLCEEKSAVLADGTIEVSTTYYGKRYTQRLTPEQINESFGKALSSYDKKI